ncbi:class I SAM-dependent methyltransferase [Streptomyces chartreusis]|uniref:class I SAM-dependent methyltransferase n=1 Tax=Streptomyces TaxID=1883 RepID=UPI002E80A49E|nr:class I SAM-dependent methyltransferase [Streptomyces chartreusis]WUB18298.1 class I SAM-dependent methyltransferase [Streptomyces chartreusis]
MTGALGAPKPVPAREVERPTLNFDVDLDGYRTYFEDDYWRLSDFSCSSAGVIDTELSFLAERLPEWDAHSVLDVGCGRGRHVVPLALAGYDVVGVDISSRNIELAERAVEEQQAAARVLHVDARELELERTFDVALFMLSSFGYHTDADNLRLLKAVRRHLVPGGRVVLDQPNREQLVAGFLNRSWVEVGGHYYLMHYSLDLHAGARDGWLTVWNPGGEPRNYFHRLRLYTTTEMREVLHVAGFELETVVGDFSNALTRGDKTSRRLQYIARAV